MTDIQRTVDAVWRIESARIVATLAKMTGDVGLAEDLAQEALVDALTQWPESGVPQNAGAWLTAVAKRKAIDGWRRRERLDERYRAIAHDLSETTDDEWQPIDDDVVRLVFTACHPVLSRESQVALTLRVVAGLTTEEIARLLLVPVATVQQRIVRAKKTLSAAHVPFEAPDPGEWTAAARRRARRRVPGLHRGLLGDRGRPMDSDRDRERGAAPRPRARRPAAA